jgi:hypothetical protein
LVFLKASEERTISWRIIGSTKKAGCNNRFRASWDRSFHSNYGLSSKLAGSLNYKSFNRLSVSEKHKLALLKNPSRTGRYEAIISRA